MPRATRAERLSCLAGHGRSGLKPRPVPRAWVDAVASVLGGGPGVQADAALISAAVATARACRSPARPTRPTLPARLLAHRRRSANPAELRLDALAAVPGGLIKPDPKLFTS